jgi:hypothetical protein
MSQDVSVEGPLLEASTRPSYDFNNQDNELLLADF